MCQFGLLNANNLKHNFGSCNLTEFNSHNFFATVINTCGENQTECSEGCRSNVEELYNHVCTKSVQASALRKFAGTRNQLEAAAKAKFTCDNTPLKTTPKTTGSAQTKLTSSTVLSVLTVLCSSLVIFTGTEKSWRSR